MFLRLPIAILLRNSISICPSLVIKAPRNTNLSTTSIFSPSTIIESSYPVAITLVFLTFRYNPAFSLDDLTFSISSIRSSLLPAINVVSSAYLRFYTFLPPMPMPLSHLSRASRIIFSA